MLSIARVRDSLSGGGWVLWEFQRWLRDQDGPFGPTKIGHYREIGLYLYALLALVVFL